MADRIDFSESSNLPSLANELLQAEAIYQEVKRNGSKEEMKAAKDLIAEKKKLVHIEEDLIRIGEKYLGDLRIRKDVEDGYNRLVKELNKEFKNLNISEKERLEILGKVTEKIRQENKGLLDVAGSLQNIGGKLKGFAMSLVGATAAISLFNRMQGERRATMTMTGIGGGSTNGMAFSAFPGITKYTTYGQMLGYSPKESIDYASRLGKEGFITGKTGGNLNDIINISQAGMAAQSRYSVSDDAMSKIMHMLTFNLNMSSDKLGGAFVRLAKNVEGTNMNMPEFASNFATLAPEFAKYGSNINDATGIIKRFSDSLVRGTINIGNFTSAFSSRANASTGNQVGFYMLAKRYGVELPGLNISSNNPLDIGGQTREWAQTHFPQALNASLQLADKMSKDMGTSTKAGGAEAISLFGSMMPEISSLFSNVPISEQKRLIGLVRNNKFTQAQDEYDKITGATGKETKDLLAKQSTAYSATAGTKELLEKVISGAAAFHVINGLEEGATMLIDSLAGNTGKKFDSLAGYAGRDLTYEDIHPGINIKSLAQQENEANLLNQKEQRLHGTLIIKENGKPDRIAKLNSKALRGNQ